MLEELSICLSVFTKIKQNKNINLFALWCVTNNKLCIQTRAKYLSIGKSMKQYEDTKYETWKEHVEQVLPSLLKRNLLIKPTARASSAIQASPHHSAQANNTEEAGDAISKCL